MVEGNLHSTRYLLHLRGGWLVAFIPEFISIKSGSESAEVVWGLQSTFVPLRASFKVVTMLTTKPSLLYRQMAVFVEVRIHANCLLCWW
jgi:hypothetical protein